MNPEGAKTVADLIEKDEDGNFVDAVSAEEDIASFEKALGGAAKLVSQLGGAKGLQNSGLGTSR